MLKTYFEFFFYFSKRYIHSSSFPHEEQDVDISGAEATTTVSGLTKGRCYLSGFLLFFLAYAHFCCVKLSSVRRYPSSSFLSIRPSVRRVSQSFNVCPTCHSRQSVSKSETQKSHKRHKSWMRRGNQSFLFRNVVTSAS